MKNFNTLILISFLTFQTLFVSAQTQSWSLDIEDNVDWQKVTFYGNYLVSTSNGMLNLNQKNGETLWENNLIKGFSESQVNEISGSSLLSAMNENHLIVFDPFDGKIKFNSVNKGLAEVDFQKFLFKSNTIFISGKDKNDKPKIFLINNESGSIGWELTEDFGRIIAVNEISNNEIILTTLNYVYKLNTFSGNIIWKNATSQEAQAAEDMGLGDLFGALTEEFAKNIEIDISYFQNSKKNIFVLASEVKNETETSDGKIEIKFTNNYTAFNIKDGSRIWKSSIEMEGKVGSLAFYNDGVIILPDDGNKTKINYYNLNTNAEGLWGKKGRGFNIKGGINQHLKIGENYLLISSSGNNSFLNLLNPQSGELVFDKPINISGEVVKVKQVEAGIAFITTEEMNIFEISTGDLLLKKSISTNPNLTILKDGFIYAFDTKSNLLKSINTKNGEEKEISLEKLKFGGKEDPKNLEERNNGFLISSDQNLALIDENGNIVFNNYFDAVGESGFKKALLYAQAVRAAYIGATSYASAAAFQSVESKENSVSGVMADGFASAYEEMGNQASDFAKKSFQQARERFNATSAGKDFNIILTKIEKSIFLIKVNKYNGEIEGKIDLGKEKNPNYSLDEITGFVFVLTGDKTISAYKL